jgi:hypothetical protein
MLLVGLSLKCQCRLGVIRDRVEPGSKSGYVRYAADCVAKLLAALRTRNYRIQMNGVFESTLRASARP